MTVSVVSFFSVMTFTAKNDDRPGTAGVPACPCLKGPTPSYRVAQSNVLGSVGRGQAGTPAVPGGMELNHIRPSHPAIFSIDFRFSPTTDLLRLDHRYRPGK